MHFLANSVPPFHSCLPAYTITAATTKAPKASQIPATSITIPAAAPVWTGGEIGETGVEEEAEYVAGGAGGALEEALSVEWIVGGTGTELGAVG